MFFIILLCLISSSRGNIHKLSLEEQIPGVWNITQVFISQDGKEKQDEMQYTINMTKVNSKFVFIGDLIDLNRANGNYQVQIDYNNNTKEITLNLANKTIVTENIKVTMDNVKYIHSIIPNTRMTYSFVALSSYRAELTVYNPQNGNTTIFRMFREYDISSGPSGFLQYIQFFMQKVLFHMF